MSERRKEGKEKPKVLQNRYESVLVLLWSVVTRHMSLQLSLFQCRLCHSFICTLPTPFYFGIWRLYSISFFWGHLTLWQNSLGTRNLLKRSLGFTNLWVAQEKSAVQPQTQSRLVQSPLPFLSWHESGISPPDSQWQETNSQLLKWYHTPSTWE